MPKLLSDTAAARRAAFAAAYVGPARFNATEAARMVGYTGTAGSLKVQGQRLLAEPQVIELLNQAVERAQMQVDEAARILTRQARGSMANFLTLEGPVGADLERARANGDLVLMKKFKQTTRSMTLQDGTSVDTTTLEFELYDAQRALQMLGEWRGMFAGNKAEQDVAEAEKPMGDQDYIALVTRLGIPQEKWNPGVLRRLKGRRAKVVSSSEVKG
jgi:phage terminase small subunit